MNKTISRCALISAAALVVGLAFVSPWVLSDENAFLKGFVNQELLALVGVIVTITLASAANLHLQLNSFEERVQRQIFIETKVAVRRSAYSLIWMLLLALALVVAKPMIIHHDNHETAAALVNGSGLLIVLFSILVLADLTQLAFRIGPSVESPSRDSAQPVPATRR